MIIECVNVKNYRSILNETLHLKNITTLIGPNGVGKSSFLKAIEIFYKSDANYSQEDFYNEDVGDSKNKKKIEITITYRNLARNEKVMFKKYVKDDKLIVKKVLEWPKSKGSQRYYGKHLQNPDFDDFRKATGRDLSKEYNKLKNNGYETLPEYTNQENGRKALSEWENNNPTNCKLKEDEGQFFGFKNVGKTKLERMTKFIYIPAVLDAADEASDNKKSVFTQIMDIVIRSTLSQKKEYEKLETTLQSNYTEFMDKQGDALKNLEKNLSETLGVYVPNSRVKIDWQHQDIKIPMPNAEIDLIEDDYGTSVERCGHGLQRAYIMSMFQYLAKITAEKSLEENETNGLKNRPPTIIIGIEEPEIYQHPNMQRYLSKILKMLAEDSLPGVAEKIQIIYSTHSPLFVDLEKFECIRKLNKKPKEDTLPNITKIYSTSFIDVVNFISKADNNGNYTPKGFEGRINAIMTPWMNEGFFADMIVLVEGVMDRAAIIGCANALKEELNEDLEGNGISVIPCMGKNNIHQPYAIFSKFNIPIFTIWDSDFKKYQRESESKQNNEINKNHRLLKLCGCEPEDWPDHVAENHACFQNELEDTLRHEIGEPLFDQIIQDCQDFYGMSKKDALKRPKVIEHLVKTSNENGKSSETLENIIKAIYVMKKSIDSDSEIHTEIQELEILDEIPTPNNSNSGNNRNLDKWIM